MASLSTPTANPATDAAALLRRLGFGILMFFLPVTAMFARRAVVILAPLGIALLVIAAVIDGNVRPVGEAAKRLLGSKGGLAGLLVLAWCALSLVWTPFPMEASERLLNILGTVLMAIAGCFALPDRMRSANLYILPVGVAVAALLAMILVVVGGDEEDMQNLDRGLTVLVLLLWPAVGWLRSRGRHTEALALAFLVALATVLGPFSLPLQGLAAGAVLFGITAFLPSLGKRIALAAMVGLLVVAPLLPLLLAPLADVFLGATDPVTTSLESWRLVVVNEPLRLITGHGFETALRGRFIGLLPPNAPSTLVFEVWYELGIVGAVAGAVALAAAIHRAGREHFSLLPGIIAAFTSAFAFATLGIGAAQIWWFTALAVAILIAAASERGQFRTTRPKAIFRRSAAAHA